MLSLIFKTIIIFIIINILEVLFLLLFNVKKSIIASMLLNNILGIVMLFTMNYFNIFINKISIFDLVLTSSTGIIGLIYILLKIIIF